MVNIVRATYRTRPTLLAIALGLAALGALLPDRLNVQASPRSGFAPLTVRVRVRLQPDADDRWLQVLAVSEESSFASDFQLDGSTRPDTRWLTWRLPPGEYVVLARLGNNVRVSAQASTTVTVLGGHAP